MFIAKSFLCLAALLLAVSAQKPKVTVYHESLCPGCIYFVTNQLYITYQKLGDVFQLDMVPYGFATYTTDASGNIKFTCQHGDNECKGNKYEACALNQDRPQRNEIEFLNCILSGTPYDDNFVRQCSIQNDYDWTILSYCFEGAQGDNLLVGYGNRTAMANLNVVPTIVFNDVFDEQKNEFAYQDFLGALCNELPTPKPSGCPS